MADRDAIGRLRASIAVGDEQDQPGDVHAWTSESLETLKQEADEADQQGVPIRDDVRP